MTNELGMEGLAAAKKFLEHKGYEVIDCKTPEGIDIVAEDFNDMTLVFINVMTYDGTSESEFPKERTLSKKELHEMETKVFKYFKRHGSKDTNFQIRFDDLTIVKLSDDKAFVRHFINITG